MSIPIANARGFERIVLKSTIVFTWATTSPATTSGRSLQLCMSILHDDDFLWSLKELFSFKSFNIQLLNIKAKKAKSFFRITAVSRNFAGAFTKLLLNSMKIAKPTNLKPTGNSPFRLPILKN